MLFNVNLWSHTPSGGELGWMKYFSMFSGIGGFELGIERAYSFQPLATLKQEPQRGNRPINESKPDVHGRFSAPLCAGYSEIDKYAIATYEAHFKHRNYGNATAIDPRHLPDFDLLMGGFPCQAFSVAGKRRGFDDTRGTLFFEIARILRDKRPRHILLENVKGLLTHQEGKTFQTILGVLANLGYGVEWQVLNSKDFGVPQNRERVFIVGHLRGKCGRQVFPIGEANESPIGQHDQRFQGSHPTEQQDSRQTETQPNPDDSDRRTAYTISSTQAHATTMKELSPTLPQAAGAGGGHVPMVHRSSQIRRLTPTECERLQGFPDDWTIGSDTQRYKQCGNAVTVNTVQAIMERFCES